MGVRLHFIDFIVFGVVPGYLASPLPNKDR